LSDNLLQHVAEQADGRPGRPISIDHEHDVRLLGVTGALDAEDVLWAVRNLKELGFLKGKWLGHFCNGYLTATGWQRLAGTEVLSPGVPCVTPGLPGQFACRVLASDKTKAGWTAGGGALRAQDRILEIARRLGAQRYVNAPGGRSLYDPVDFEPAGIELCFLPQGPSTSILSRLMTEDRNDLSDDIVKGAF